MNGSHFKELNKVRFQMFYFKYLAWQYFPQIFTAKNILYDFWQIKNNLEILTKERFLKRVHSRDLTIQVFYFNFR